MARRSSPRRSPRKSRKSSPRKSRKSSPRKSRKSSPRKSRKSSPRRSSGKKLNAYAKYVKKHYAAAKKAAGKGAKSTTVFKKVAAMYRMHKKH
jgi:hypothetical protein